MHRQQKGPAFVRSSGRLGSRRGNRPIRPPAGGQASCDMSCGYDMDGDLLSFFLSVLPPFTPFTTRGGVQRQRRHEGRHTVVDVLSPTLAQQRE